MLARDGVRLSEKWAELTLVRAGGSLPQVWGARGEGRHFTATDPTLLAALTRVGLGIDHDTAEFAVHRYSPLVAADGAAPVSAGPGAEGVLGEVGLPVLSPPQPIATARHNAEARRTECRTTSGGFVRVVRLLS